VIKLVLIVAIFRSFFFSPFNIPSESMLPRLEDGDYLLAAKWPYGFSRYSLPYSLPLLPAKRIFAGQPERGDVVIFKALRAMMSTISSG
jgi:signal peptidase I